MADAKPAKRKSAIVRVGMTHSEARAAVAAVWPGLELSFYHNSEGYRRDGSRHEGTATNLTDVLYPVGRFYTGPPPPFPPPRKLGEVKITGTTTFDELVKMVYCTFGLAPELSYPLYEHRSSKYQPDHSTMTKLHREAEKQRIEFTAKHGRPPIHTDRLWSDGDGWYGFGVFI
jgi:hypothetical protein